MDPRDTGETLLADVALPVPVPRAFTYLVPASIAGRAVRGARVICPFGSRRLVGVVLALSSGSPPAGAKAILRAVDEDVPAVPVDLLDFLRELASYYLAPIGEVLRLALPPVPRKVEDELREPSLFPAKRGGLSPRRVRWAVMRDDAPPAPALRGQALAVWQHLQKAREAEVARLADTWKNARGALSHLVTAGLVRIDERAAVADPFFREAAPPEPPPDLTPAQTEAVLRLERALATEGPSTFLLHGVTGSGKTEVYFAAIVAARARGSGTLVLVPEIALTPQLDRALPRALRRRGRCRCTRG